MSENPKRRWFCFHLLTLVLMSLAAGGVLWANIGKHWNSNLELPEVFRGYTRGWPFVMEGDGGFLESVEALPLQPEWLMLNVLVSLALVTFVALLSEHIIRRREDRKAEAELLTKAGAVFDLACGWGRTPYDPQVRARLNAEGFDCSQKLEELAAQMHCGPDNLVVQETVKTMFLLFAIHKTETEPDFVARMKSYLELDA